MIIASKSLLSALLVGACLCLASISETALAQAPLVEEEWKGRAYYFQESKDSESARVLVYFHGLSPNRPLLPETHSGMLASLRKWAWDHNFALIVPISPQKECDGIPDPTRDLWCWPIRNAEREMRRINRLVSAVQEEKNLGAQRMAIGFSRGAYFLSVAWAAGELRGWTGAGLLSGGQMPAAWGPTHHLPPIAIEVGRSDQGNGPIVSRFADAVKTKRPAVVLCDHSTDSGHLPADGNMAAFLNFAHDCADLDNADSQ